MVSIRKEDKSDLHYVIKRVIAGEQSALQKLLETFAPLVITIVKEFAARGSADFEDLCQLGRVAIVGAAKAYRLEKGGGRKYFETAIRNAVYQEGRSARRRRDRVVSFSDIEDESNDNVLENVLAVECPMLEGVDDEDFRTVAIKRVREWKGALRPQDRRVMEMIFVGGLNQTKVAGRLGLTRARVSQIVQNVYESGRIHLADLALN